MKTYLVTGGAGFIGSNFVKYILDVSKDAYIVNVDKLTYAGNLDNIIELASNPRHVFAQVDICDSLALEKLFEKFKPDYVVNFAAESHVDRSIECADDFINTNVAGTGNLLKLCKQFWEIGDGMYGDKKFLQVSTDEVYGSLSLENKDEYFTETTPLNPHSPYSASKAAADLLVKAYFDTHRLPINITRCSNNYGPYQFPEKLIPLCINKAINHEHLPVYGDGLNIRDWLFVKDHCKAIDMVLEFGEKGQIYNVGGHNEHPNIKIVESIIDICSIALDDNDINKNLIKYVEDRKGHDRRYGIDPSKIFKAIAWAPQTNFEDGISFTIAWYLSHKKWVEKILDGSYKSIDVNQFYTEFK